MYSFPIVIHEIRQSVRLFEPSLARPRSHYAFRRL